MNEGDKEGVALSARAGKLTLSWEGMFLKYSQLSLFSRGHFVYPGIKATGAYGQSGRHF